MWFWWSIGLTISTLSGIFIVKKHRDAGLPILMTLFAGYVLSANILVPRIASVNLGFGEMILTTGSIIWPFTAQILDMINEVYGRKKAYLAVFGAFLINVLFITFVFLGNSLTAQWDSESEAFWSRYFETAPRILLASWVTFLLAHSLDIVMFSRLKEFFREKHEETNVKNIILFCTTRSMTSDLANMILDGMLFATLAFAFVVPVETLWSLITGSIATKAFLAFLDTPWYIAFRLGIRHSIRES